MANNDQSSTKQVKFADELESYEEDSDTRPLIKKSSLKTNDYASINNESSTSEPGNDYNFLDIEDVNENIFASSYNFVEGLPQHSTDFLENETDCLDYDKIYNLIDLKDKDELYAGRYMSQKQMSRWIVMFLVGLLTGLVAVMINFFIEKIADFKYHLISRRITECSTMHCLWEPLGIWIASNGGLALIAALLVVFIAPVAKGSGIPAVKCYLNGIKIPYVVRFSTLFVKAVGVIFAVTGGLACGKEGPMIHSGAIIAAGVSQGLSTSLKFDLKIFKYFRSDTEKRDFVSGGAAAGVAAAFGAPVGGVLFSLEEGASFWNQALTWRIFFGSMISTFTLNIFISLINGKFGDLSNPGLINFGKFTNAEYVWFEIPIFILMGAIGGLLGALFNYINIKLTQFRTKYIRSNISQLAEVVLVACTSAAVGFLLSFYFSADCQPIGRDSVSKYTVQLFCDDGQYNAMLSLFFQTPEASVRSMFHDPIGSFQPITLIVFFITYFILATWTYGLAVPSGLFIPSLLIGGSWGRLVGIGVNNMIPSMHLDAGKYALIGAASQLGGIVRMTLSLTVIITEACGDITLGIPIMLAIMVSKIVGDLFNEGLFDMHIALSGSPLLDWDPPPLTKKLSARHVMSNDVLVLKEKETVGNIIDILARTKHHGFPVVEENLPINNKDNNPENGTINDTPEDNEHFGLLKGFILRHQIFTLLKKKAYLNTTLNLTPDDFRESYPRYIKLEDIEVLDEERELELDLRPYMNLAPYTLTENSNLPRIFRLFRGLGLRHLVIVDDHNRVVGIVTRIDIAKFKTHVGFKHTIVKELSVSLT